MTTADAYDPRGKRPPTAGSWRLRFWSVRHARGLATLWHAVEASLTRMAPLARRLGPERLERPLAAVERTVKGALFDCRMCGQCILSQTGMACPMNCPKALRNGPCGGVRQDGHCEVRPDMPCVWVQAVTGSALIDGSQTIRLPQPPVDHRRKGRSSWLPLMGMAD